MQLEGVAMFCNPENVGINVATPDGVGSALLWVTDTAVGNRGDTGVFSRVFESSDDTGT